MSNTNTGGPAFPVNYRNETLPGMTLRDYLAAKAMQAIVSHEPTFVKEFVEMAARDAYAYADAMLKARQQ